MIYKQDTPVARVEYVTQTGSISIQKLSVRSQRQRVFSTPDLRCALVAREVAIREVQPRD